MGESAGHVVLTVSQSACLHALRTGKSAKTVIAIGAKCDLRNTAAALEALERLDLAERFGKHGWRATERGKTCSLEVVPDKKQRSKAGGRGRPATAGERFLEALERPMRGMDMAERLGVSPQRVSQIVVGLFALGRLRLGNEESILEIFARADDPTVLLSRDEARVLSVMPDDYATDMAKIREVAAISGERANAALEVLLVHGLVVENAKTRGASVYRVTVPGLAHPQRRGSAGRADRPRPPVQSDRIFAVLSHIAAHGRARIKDVGDALAIPRSSMNALMQYMKRKSLVRKAGGEFAAPYILTDEGREALAELTRRRAAPGN